MRSIRQISSFLIPFIVFTILVIFLTGFANQENAKEEELEATIRRVWEEAYNRGNMDVFDEFYTTDMVKHISPYPDIKSLDSYKKLCAGWLVTYPDIKITIDEIIVKGETSVVRWTFLGTHKELGKQVTYPGCTVSHHRVDGKIVEEWQYEDDLGLQRQLGN
ncbi:ester cyclase [Candidatus Latescibacterota bacterium]